VTIDAAWDRPAGARADQYDLSSISVARWVNQFDVETCSPMSPTGPSLQFAAALQFDHFRSEAEIQRAALTEPDDAAQFLIL
jgi:hypothetical protein